MKQSALAVALVAFLCCAISAHAADFEMSTGVVTMTTTGSTNSIELNVSIADNGEVPGCTFFIIMRGGTQVAFFPRQPGVQNTFSYTETNVAPKQLYWYELKASPYPVPAPTPACDEIEFRYAFGSGWGTPIDIPGSVGTDPIPLAHGKLVADDGWPGAHLEPCNSPHWWFFEYGLPAGFEQYIGQEVLMYGEYSVWSVQNGWIPTITAFQPLPCAPVATESATWGQVKSIYR